jgi:hypothetical protein
VSRRWLVTVALVAAALTGGPGSVPLLTAQAVPGLGEPLPNLSAELLKAFNEGRRRFSTT